MRSRHFVAAVLAAAAVLSSVVESQSSSVVEALNCEQCFRTSSGAASRNVWCPSRRCAPSASACVSPSSFDTKNGCALADSVRACRRLSSTCQTRASVMTAAERDRASQVSEEDRRDVLRRKRLRKKAARKAAKHAQIRDSLVLNVEKASQILQEAKSSLRGYKLEKKRERQRKRKQGNRPRPLSEKERGEVLAYAERFSGHAGTTVAQRKIVGRVGNLYKTAPVKTDVRPDQLWGKGKTMSNGYIRT